MWDNKVLKQKAKERMKVNYWKMLLVGLIIALVSGGTRMHPQCQKLVHRG